MQINLEYNTTTYTIRSYAEKTITINPPHHSPSNSDDERLSNPSVIVTASFILSGAKMIDNWPPQTMNDLTAQHFEIIAHLKPEVVVFGTGKQLRFPKPEHTLSLIHQGIGMEVMTTAAACRTYNFLAADGRRVAAALLMIQ